MTLPGQSTSSAAPRRGRGVMCACGAGVVRALTQEGDPVLMAAQRRVDGTFVLSHRRVGEPPVAVPQTDAERATLRAQAASRGEELRLFVVHHCPAEDVAA